MVVGNDLYVGFLWFAFFFEYLLYAHVVKKKKFQTMFCLCFLTRRQPHGGAPCALLASLADQPVPHAPGL